MRIKYNDSYEQEEWDEIFDQMWDAFYNRNRKKKTPYNEMYDERETAMYSKLYLDEDF